MPRPRNNENADSALVALGFALQVLETKPIEGLNTDEEQLLVNQALVQLKEKMEICNYKSRFKI